MNAVKGFLKAVIYTIVFLWIVFFGIILFAVFTDFKPDEKISLSENASVKGFEDSASVSILIWNIGYCGLDDKMDFFYDGGTKVRPDRETFNINFEGVSEFIRKNDTVDFIMLQEVDRKSKRSYRKDQYEAISDMLGLPSQFAANYDVFFVPVPPSSPMGKVYSGISISGKHQPSSSVRHSFPGQYGFPKQLFMLDRCFIVNRYPVEGGRELVLINTHNEAFDPGDIRKAQMDYLKNFITGEYEKGNFVIAGGDWNQCPPEFIPGFDGHVVNTSQMMLEKDFLPAGWKWVYDNTVPSNRTVTGPYRRGVTATTVIDFFLLSPNVKNLSVKCIDLDFRYSDHNPVIITASMNI